MANERQQQQERRQSPRRRTNAELTREAEQRDGKKYDTVVQRGSGGKVLNADRLAPQVAVRSGAEVPTDAPRPLISHYEPGSEGQPVPVWDYGPNQDPVDNPGAYGQEVIGQSSPPSPPTPPTAATPASAPTPPSSPSSNPPVSNGPTAEHAEQTQEPHSLSQMQSQGDTFAERRESDNEPISFLNHDVNQDPISNPGAYGQAVSKQPAQPQGYTPEQIGITPAYRTPVRRGLGGRTIGGNVVTPLTPEQRGYAQLPDGSYRPGGSRTPYYAAQGDEGSGLPDDPPTRYQGEIVADNERFGAQPQGTLRQAVGGVPGFTGQPGGTMVSDIPIDPDAPRYGTYQNRDGTFTGLGRSGNQGGFDTQEEAREWSITNFDPRAMEGRQEDSSRIAENVDREPPVANNDPRSTPSATPATPTGMVDREPQVAEFSPRDPREAQDYYGRPAHQAVANVFGRVGQFLRGQTMSPGGDPDAEPNRFLGIPTKSVEPRIVRKQNREYIENETRSIRRFEPGSPQRLKRQQKFYETIRDEGLFDAVSPEVWESIGMTPPSGESPDMDPNFNRPSQFMEGATPGSDTSRSPVSFAATPNVGLSGQRPSAAPVSTNTPHRTRSGSISDLISFSPEEDKILRTIADTWQRRLEELYN